MHIYTNIYQVRTAGVLPVFLWQDLTAQNGLHDISSMSEATYQQHVIGSALSLQGPSDLLRPYFCLIHPAAELQAQCLVMLQRGEAHSDSKWAIHLPGSQAIGTGPDHVAEGGLALQRGKPPLRFLSPLPISPYRAYFCHKHLLKEEETCRVRPFTVRVLNPLLDLVQRFPTLVRAPYSPCPSVRVGTRSYGLLAAPHSLVFGPADEYVWHMAGILQV